MHDKQIYKIRQALRQSETNTTDAVNAALSRARQKAVERAAGITTTSTTGFDVLGFRLWPKHLWGVGASLASVAAVLIGLQIVEKNTIDQNLQRLAVIDQKMITGPLPVQAYLDPGFLVFQESLLEQASADRPAISSVAFTERIEELRNRWSAETLFPGFKGIPPGPAWAKLTVNQREALAPLESLWADMEAHRRQKWLRIADRFPLLSPEQRALAQERMQDWVSMPAIDRRQARAVFDGVKEAIPEDVRVMKWNEYQKLTPKQREKLVELAQQRSGTGPDISIDAAGEAMKSGPVSNAVGADVNNAAASIPTPRSALAKQSDKPLISR